MGHWIKQSTAQTVKMGPFLDEDDGVTEEEALSVVQGDIRISKNGGAFAQSNNAAGASHDENGYYGVPLDTTDSGTLGYIRVVVHKAGALPVWDDFLVVPANTYDSLVLGSDNIDSTPDNASDVIAIKDVTDIIPNSGAMTDIDTGVNNIEAKLPTNEIMGSSDKTDKDDDIGAILADTNELQIDWTNGGRLDLLVDAIKAVTDNLPDNGSLNDLTTLIAGVVLTAAGIDAVFERPSSNYEDAAYRSLAGVVSKLTNRVKSNTVSGKFEVYKSDDSTKQFEQIQSTSGAVEPTVELNTE